MNASASATAPAKPVPKDFLPALRAQEAALRNLASTLCRNRARAERLLAHVMAKAEREHASFQRGTNFSAWLMKMMRTEFSATLTASGLVEAATATAASWDVAPPEPDVAPTPLPAAAPRVPRRRPEPRRRAAPAAEDIHRPIDVRPFMTALRPPRSADLGPLPELAWLPIADLRIDQRYQREILRRGRGNVIRIHAEFDWRMFTPVIVSRIAGTALYAIVDGQHRSTAAACREIPKVPCLIIDADPCEQAAAFAAINGNVTQMSSLQLHAARIAAGDKAAIRLDEVCAAAGVEILRYPVPASNIGVGQTLAVSCLAKSLAAYGQDVLTAALLCITATRDGNVGLLRAPLIRGLCQTISRRPQLAADPEEAMRIAEDIDFEHLLDGATLDARRMRVPMATAVTARLEVPFGAGRKAA